MSSEQCYLCGRMRDINLPENSISIICEDYACRTEELQVLLMKRMNALTLLAKASIIPCLSHMNVR